MMPRGMVLVVMPRCTRAHSRAANMWNRAWAWDMPSLAARRGWARLLICDVGEGIIRLK